MDAALVPYVAVPAHDEAARLPRLVQALGRQGHLVRLTVLLNNSTDASASVLEQALAQVPNVAGQVIITTLPRPFANAGCARRLALDAARDRAIADGVPIERLTLLTTDADAEPMPDWIAANLAALEAGADLVGGRISVFADEEAQLGPDVLARARQLSTLQDSLTRIECFVDPVTHDPWPRHHDTLGASLAIRGTMYARIGGAPVRAQSEDLALASEVRLHGGRVRRCPNVRVAVSARIMGRASGGMAQTLRTWIEDAAQSRAMKVEAPWLCVARMYERARLRRWFETRHGALDAGSLDTELMSAAHSSPSADAFVERLLPAFLPPTRMVSLDDAVAWLAKFEAGPGWFGSGTALVGEEATRSVGAVPLLSHVHDPQVA